MKKMIFGMIASTALVLTTPRFASAASLLLPGGILVQTARGSLLLVPAMANAKDKKEPSAKNPKKGRSGQEGLGGRFEETGRRGESSRGRSETYEDGGRWGGNGGGRYGLGGDSYGGSFSVSAGNQGKEDMGRLVKQSQPEDMGRLVKVGQPDDMTRLFNQGTVLAAALFLSANTESISPIYLEDHLAKYLENESLFQKQTENLAMPATQPADLEKLTAPIIQKITRATESMNEMQNWKDQNLNQLAQYLENQGLDFNDPANQIVAVVTLNSSSVSELSQWAPEATSYLESLLLKNE